MAMTADAPPSHGPRSLAGFDLQYLVWGAPVAAVLAGMAAQWLDFRALRQPLLILVLVGVVATTYVLADGRRGIRAFFIGFGVGFAAWAGEQLVYTSLHIASGERFTAEQFGPQWAQALVLIIAHATLLGLPTGAIAGLLLHLPPLRRAGRSA
jgi:hypothetical protein